MCGIAGFYGFRNDDLIKKFSKELAHRGPDGEGFDIDDTVSLMNRRLAIIDVKGGDQPIYNEDRSVVIVFVGEIYNYRSLTEELIKKGHVFRTKSDTEMIIHSYEEWGEKSFDRFNGMFVFALYDKKKKKLILARDHFGIKPLYYSTVKGGILFSSEIKPILYSGLVKKKPNDKIIYRYLTFRVHEDSHETFFEGIYRLMPGQMMIVENGKWRMENYSNLEQELMQSNERKKVNEDTIKGFKKKLIEAVKLRLISEVPVGSCLSGGLDSSTVVTIVNRLLKEKVKEAASVGKIQNTFSAVFPNQANDEEQYIDKILEENKVKSHKVKPTPEEFFTDIQDFVRTQEEPTISTGPYAQYKVMQLAHRKITVALDGQGSDEMMAGYLPYYFVYLKELWKKKLFLKLAREVFTSLDVVSKYSTGKILYLLGIKKKIETAKLLNNTYLEKYSGETFTVTSDDIRKRLVEDIFHNSLQSLLRYEDRNAMRFSIEGRVPFLDFNLLRYLFSLDTDAIIKNGWNKYILRESTKDLLPELINKRRNKIGFTTPEYDWFMRMKNKIYSIFLSESFSRRKYFNQQEVLTAFQGFIEGKIEDTMVFWRLLNLELWLREFLDPPSHKAAEVQLGSGVFEPNEGKKLETKVDGITYYRFPVKTGLFKNGDKYPQRISKYISSFIDDLTKKEKFIKLKEKKWFVVVSEKIVAISQGRAYFIWDIKPNFIANILSKFVKRTPYGIGLGSPWTMQLAIQEVGLPRILFATVMSIVTRPLGIKGMFYKIAGPVVRSIDGPTEYSLYPSNVSAKLGPEEPEKAAEDIKKGIGDKILGTKDIESNFLGAAIIDANDLGQNVLGNSTSLESKVIEKIFGDNPMGQANEQTPLTIVFKK